MKAHSLVAALVVCAASRGASAQPPKLDDGDTRIVTYVHAIDQLELQMGNLAQRNGSPAMQVFGATLATNFRATDKALVALARARGLATIPVEAPLDPDHRPVADAQSKLQTMQGADFDHEFLDVMIDAQDSELENVDNGIASAADPELAALLRGLDSSIRAHLITAQNLKRY